MRARWLALLFLSAIARADGPSAAEIRHRFPNVFVRVQTEAAFGSGVVVRNNQPIVATCYHVIEHANAIKVFDPNRNRFFDVDLVSVQPDADLAFLRPVDVATWGGKVPWDPSAAALSRDDDVQVDGFSLVTPDEIHSLRVTAPRTPLNLLKVNPVDGTPAISPRVGDMIVIDLANGDLFEGDSGGPIFNGAYQLVGLAAGRVIQDTDAKRYFATPVLAPIPPDDQFKPFREVVGGADPYDGADASIRHYVHRFDSQYELVSRKPDDRCVQEYVKATRRDPTNPKPPPAKLPGDVTPACQKAYSEARPLIVAERQAWAQTEDSARSLRLARNAELDAERFQALFERMKRTNKREAIASVCTASAKCGNGAFSSYLMSDNPEVERRALASLVRDGSVPVAPQSVVRLPIAEAHERSMSALLKSSKIDPEKKQEIVSFWQQGSGALQIAAGTHPKTSSLKASEIAARAIEEEDPNHRPTEALTHATANFDDAAKSIRDEIVRIFERDLP